MKKLASLWRRIFRIPIQRIEIIPRDPMRVTLAEWRATPDLVNVARAAISSKPLQFMIDVLRTEHLGMYSVTERVSIEERAVHAARAEGYSIALNNLLAMGSFQKPPAQIEETFEKPEIETIEP